MIELSGGAIVKIASANTFNNESAIEWPLQRLEGRTEAASGGGDWYATPDSALIPAGSVDG